MADFYTISADQTAVDIPDFALSSASPTFVLPHSTALPSAPSARLVFDVQTTTFFSSAASLIKIITRCDTNALTTGAKRGHGIVVASAAPACATTTFSDGAAPTVAFENPVTFGIPVTLMRTSPLPTEDVPVPRGIWGGEFEDGVLYRIVVDTTVGASRLSVNTVYSIYLVDSSGVMQLFVSETVSDLDKAISPTFNGVAFLCETDTGVVQISNAKLLIKPEPRVALALGAAPPANKVKVEVSHPDIFYFEGLEEFTAMPFLLDNPDVVDHPYDHYFRDWNPHHTQPTMTSRGVTIRDDTGRTRRDSNANQKWTNRWFLTPALKLCIKPEVFEPLWKHYKNAEWTRAYPTGTSVYRSVSQEKLIFQPYVSTEGSLNTIVQGSSSPTVSGNHVSRHVEGSSVDSDVLQMFAYGSGPLGIGPMGPYACGVCEFPDPSTAGVGDTVQTAETMGRVGRFAAMVGAILVDNNTVPTKETAELFIDVGDIWGHEYVNEWTSIWYDSVSTISSALIAKDVWVRITIPIDTQNFK